MKIAGESKTFKDKVIFSNISVDLDKGLYKLEGINGSGKSTLLNLMAGLDKFDSGFRNTLEGDILYLDTNHLGVSPLSIRDNLKLLWKTFRIKPSDSEYTQVESFFGANIDDDYSKASLGTRAKLGLSLLLVKEWDYIFIDEAMSAVDSDGIERLSERLNNLKKTSTIVYVFHHLDNERLKRASKIIRIEEGEIYEEP